MTRELLVKRLALAISLVRDFRESLAVKRAVHALMKAAKVLSAVRETSPRADELRITALSLGAAHERRGDRWALARELEALRGEGVPSHRVARVLFDIGCCNGDRRPRAIQRCESWARSERRRYRDTHGSLSREPVEPVLHVDAQALPLSMGMEPEETTMAKVLKRTTTVTEEVLHEREAADLEEEQDEEDESEEDESEKEEHTTVRRRKHR
jgi:hypothetical protein